MELNHKGTVTLKTPRLTLRRYRAGDGEAMYRNWASDPEVARFLSWSAHQSPAESEEIVGAWIETYESEETYHWGIEYEGELIGDLAVVLGNWKHGYAELGYSLGRAYWGRGIMTEAVKEVVRFLVREIGYHRVIIRHAVLNPASGRVAEKCGFTREGVLREHFLLKRTGEFLDIACWGILDREIPD